MGRCKIELRSIPLVFHACLLFWAMNVAFASEPEMGSARVVFQVDKGFVAQEPDVLGGRSAPMNEVQSGSCKNY